MADIAKLYGEDVANLAKVLGVDITTLSKIYGLDNPQVSIPAGLIVPYYNSGGAPSGWSLFSSANGRFIVGAGSTYSPGGSGGSASATIIISGSGSHTGTYTNVAGGGGTQDDPDYNIGAFGNHTHTASLTYTPPYRQLQLIKADSEREYFPAWALALGVQSFSGLTQYLNNDGRLFSANSALGTGGGSTPSPAYSTYAGSHRHYSNTGAPTYDPYGATNKANLYSGYHRHYITPTGATHYVKRMYLTAWANASSTFNLESGMIAMYESLTPPDGWSLCNGSGGTPDLRDYFVEFGTTGNHGTTTGNNTVNFTWTNQAHANHNHYNGVHATNTTRSCPHISNTIHPNSHGTSSTPPYTPQYYALAFVKYTG
jgi:hypothetical protein